MTVVAGATDPTAVLATLRHGSAPVEPTQRWTDEWTVDGGHLTTAPCIYGIYARRVPVTKWLSLEVRDLLETYPGEVGGGTLHGGIKPFIVPDTSVQNLGEWMLIYVGRSSDPKSPRINNYFGVSRHLTRTPGGQSFHLMLTLLFGLPVDPRISVTPRARSVIDVLRGSLSLSLEARMRDMRFGYVQVETPICDCRPCQTGCPCATCSERRILMRSARDDSFIGARPLMNAEW